jgi:cytochrome b561
MTPEAGNSLSTAAHSEMPIRSPRSFRSLRWLNGGVHWISAVVLIYAFISNGETTSAMIDPAAMRGEVRLGLVVGLIFLVRFIWVQSRRSGAGRWLGSPVRMPQSRIRRITDWGVYLGVAGSVVSGLLIAYLRPGAVVDPATRGFLTDRPSLNAAINAHVFIADALEWLCAFHAAYALWYWRIKGSQWGMVAEGWFDRAAAAADRVGVTKKLFRRSS